MDSSQNSSFILGSAHTKEKASRRSWSRPEEEALLVEMKNLIERGWRSENGFRPGYLLQLETPFKIRFPNAKLMSKHFNSKLTVWKKIYHQVFQMRDTSGFGWQDSTNQIQVNDDVWQDYVKVHPLVAKMRYKTFPYYNDWVEIFGSDRGTGEHARMTRDAILTMKHPHRVEDGIQDKENGKGMASEDPLEYMNLSSDADPTDVVGENSDNDTTQQASSKGKEKEGTKKNKYIKRRKNPRPTTHDPYVEMLGSFFKAAQNSMETIATKISGGKDGTSAKTEKVYDIIEEMAFIAPEARIFVCQKICSNPTYTNLFLKMNGERQINFVSMVLKGKVP